MSTTSVRPYTRRRNLAPDELHKLQCAQKLAWARANPDRMRLYHTRYMRRRRAKAAKAAAAATAARDAETSSPAATKGT